MAIDTTPSQVATNALAALPFGSIIGGPLKACIEAQAMAARTTWNFIQEVGLQEDPKTHEKKTINVSFIFMQNGRMVQLNVPLLTIVPIPYIAIHTIDISFKANINASSSSSSAESSSESMEAGVSGSAALNLGLFKASASFNANYSSKKDSKATQDSQYSVEYTMDVAVKAGQDSMPAGLAKVLELLGNSLDVTDPNGVLEVNSLVLNGEKGDKVQLIATYKNREGLFEPQKIHIVGIEGKVDGDNKVFMLDVNERETVYTVSVSGISKKVDVRTVDTISAQKASEQARIEREAARRDRMLAMESELAETRRKADEENAKKQAQREAEAAKAQQEVDEERARRDAEPEK